MCLRFYRKCGSPVDMRNYFGVEGGKRVCYIFNGIAHGHPEGMDKQEECYEEKKSFD